MSCAPDRCQWGLFRLSSLIRSSHQDDTFKMLIPTPGSRRRGSAQTRASRRTRSGTVADSEEERSALPTAGTWPAIEAGHRDSLLYSGGKNPRDSAATQASAHHHTHHIEADGTHTSKQDTAAQHTRTASHTPRRPRRNCRVDHRPPNPSSRSTRCAQDLRRQGAPQARDCSDSSSREGHRPQNPLNALR